MKNAQFGVVAIVRNSVVSLAVAVAFSGLAWADSPAASTDSKTKPSDKVLRHAVFFKFKDTATPDDVKRIVEAFSALPSKIDGIIDFQSGTNTSQMGMDDGLTHCFLLTFPDEAARAAYLPHDEHKAFGALLGPHLDKVFVIDYWGTPRTGPKHDELKLMAFLKFKDTASAADIRAAEEEFTALPSKIDSIKAVEWGTNNSPETHDDGFTHCVAVTFDSEEGLTKYMTAPAHEAFVQRLHQLVEKPRLISFWAKEKPAAKSGDDAK